MGSRRPANRSERKDGNAVESAGIALDLPASAAPVPSAALHNSPTADF